MPTVSRRQVLRTTTAIGMGTVFGKSAFDVSAHEIIQPTYAETLDFLSTEFTVEVLLELLNGAWELYFFSVAMRDQIDVTIRGDLESYRERNEYEGNYIQAFEQIHALRNQDIRNSVRIRLSNNEDFVYRASDRIRPVVDNVRHYLFRQQSNDQPAVRMFLYSLHHHERILWNPGHQRTDNQPILCRYFPFSRICDWLD